MDRNEIMAVFRDLAKSQGFYGRLVAVLDQMEEEDKEDFWQELEKQNFKDAVDVVIYMEE